MGDIKVIATKCSKEFFNKKDQENNAMIDKTCM